MSTASAAALRDGLDLAHWDTDDLWRAAVGMGGDFSTQDVAMLASGMRRCTGPEHDVLAAALNDHFVGLGGNHPVPYWNQIHPA